MIGRHIVGRGDPPGDDCYYRIQVTATEVGSKYTICCLQWFDEHGYDQSRWWQFGHHPGWFVREEDAELFMAANPKEFP